MNPIKILVIDDKKVIRDFFDFTLGYYGHEITAVHDPCEAAKVAGNGTFDIAFLDMIMPGRDGVSVLREVKVAAPRLPVVMMTGYSVEEKKEEALRLGACACLKKPFEVEDIRRVIKEHIGKEVLPVF